MSKAKKFLIFDLLLLIVIGGILYVKGLPFDLLKNDSEDIVVEDEITEDVEEIQEIAEPEPEIDPDEWNLVLVNPWNAIPEGYLDTVETVYTDGGYLIDSRVKDDLEQMLSDCRDAGYSPEIISAFRTRETQESLYNSTVNKNDTAVPGHSEHECGLAVDILESGYGGDWDNAEKTAETETQKWLTDHCAEYGFILRYPKDKEDITGIVYESWHYRYVGKEHAEKIMSDGVCLEEYLGRTDKTEDGTEYGTESDGEG